MISRCFIFHLLLLLIYLCFNNYFVLGQNPQHLKGCYKERAIKARLLHQVFKEYFGTLTPELCITECKKGGFTYAGIQIGKECFCSNYWPSYKYITDDQDCANPCEGDRSKICGGVFRLNIYETRNVDKNFVESNYIGCLDTSNKRLLVGKSKNFQNRLTPEVCVGYCFLSGYRYAGLIDSECTCGDADINQIRNSLVGDTECSTKCKNGKFMCGGQWRASVYTTGITDHSEDDTLIGCFDDSDKKLLTSFPTRYPENNSPKLCYNVCVGSGFKYAGTKNGAECYCGNKKPNTTLRISEEHCAIPCPGDPLSACGGISTMYVYASDVNGVGELDNYLGCFEDSPSYLFPVFALRDFAGLSVNLCINTCKTSGYLYAGVEVSLNCLCANEKPEERLLRAEADCYQPCAGAPNETCGGVWRLKAYSTGLKIPDGKPVYKGCYKDIAIASRLLHEEFREFWGLLAPKLCIDHCKDKGYTYVGLEIGKECFCSNVWPSYKYSTDEEECSFPCEGDRSLICGASLRLNVYESYEVGKNRVENNYIGCLDTSNRELIDEKAKLYPDGISPEICVGYCFRRGYRVAAVQSSECKCGDTDIELIKKNLVSENQCVIKCGNGKFICGGQKKSSVYTTGITYDSEDDRLLGCFEESPTGNLSGYSINYPENNSPKLCYNVCNGSGYKYAGVRRGDECLCGNLKPDAKHLLSAEECTSKPCPGDPNKSCGGDNRILIYTTKAKGELDGYLGCYEDSAERLLSETRKVFETNNTPERCRNHCKAYGYQYFGLETVADCYCGNNMPPEQYLRLETDCSMPCSGDPTIRCGGNWRLKLYSTSGETT